jgi:hypothetical protein
VHVLTRGQLEELYERERLGGRDVAWKYAVGYVPALALPCVPQLMADTALAYDGPHSEEVRYMAACLALDEPIEPRGTRADDSSGGQRARLEPLAPQPAGPTGAAFAKVQS